MTGFKDVVGHKEIIEYIRNAISQDKVSHAYVLNGPRGSGKKMLAKLFAMTLLCERSQTDPCGKCKSCIQAESNNNPDIIYVVPEKLNATGIGVDDIRNQVNSTVDIKPYRSAYKVYIIRDADKMTPGAQNALLKTLEEPPAYVVFLLLTENENMLYDTIISRCVKLKLRNSKDTLIKKYLQDKLGLNEYEAKVCTAFAQGNLGQAIMLAGSENFTELKNEAVLLAKRVKKMEMEDLIGAVRSAAARNKVEIGDFLDMVAIWYRDVLLYKATTDIDGVIFREDLETIKERARKSSYEGIESILEAINVAKERLKANVNSELSLELLFLTLKEN